MIAELLERLRIHSVAKRGEKIAWDTELNDIRMQMLAYKTAAEIEMREYMEAKEAELAQVAEAMNEADYMEAMADSFAGGPGSEGNNGNDGNGDDNAR